MKKPAIVLGIVLSWLGLMLAMAGGTLLQVYTIETLAPIWQGFVPNHIRAVAWAGSGEWLITGSDDGTVTLWQAATGTQLRTIQSDLPVVYAVAASPDGAYAVAWSPDGQQVAVGRSNKVVVFDAVTGQMMADLGTEAGDDEPFADRPQVAWLDETTLLVVDGGGAITIWQPETQSLIRAGGMAVREIITGAWSPDGEHLALSTVSGQVFLVNAATGAVMVSLAISSEASSGVPAADVVAPLTWSPDGTLLAGGAVNGRLLIWDMTNRTLVSATNLGDRLQSLAWSATGDRLFIVAGPSLQRSRMIILDPTNGRWITAFDMESPGNSGQQMLSPNEGPRGKKIVTINRWLGQVLLFDPAGQLIETFGTNTRHLNQVAWSPDGKSIAAGSDEGLLTILAAETGAIQHQIPVPMDKNRTLNDEVWYVTWSPDSRKVAATGEDGRITVWDAASGQMLEVFDGHGDIRTGLAAWSPDGARLLSVGRHNELIVWSIKP